MDTRQAIALLSYLALTGQLHSRDTLAVLFWPEYDQSQARGNFRRTLSTLTKAIATGAILNLRNRSAHMRHASQSARGRASLHENRIH